MADTDYIIRGTGHLMTMALTDVAMTASATTVPYYAMQDTTGTPIVVGMAAMIGDEIVRINSFDATTISIGRGCADTIPAAHADNTPIWFFGMDVASDSREYSTGETIGVKPLVYTQGSAPMLISETPPRTVTFNQRFARPYPPGNFTINGQPWHITTIVMAPAATSMVLAWAHRDRILQDDTLISHDAASIGPEIGTTYTVEIYTLLGVLITSYSGLTGTTWSYSRANAESDLGATIGRLKLFSVRDGLDSFQKYEAVIEIQIGRTGDMAATETASDTAAIAGVGA